MAVSYCDARSIQRAYPIEHIDVAALHALQSSAKGLENSSVEILAEFVGVRRIHGLHHSDRRIHTLRNNECVNEWTSFVATPPSQQFRVTTQAYRSPALVGRLPIGSLTELLFVPASLNVANLQLRLPERGLQSSPCFFDTPITPAVASAAFSSGSTPRVGRYAGTDTPRLG
jgi:hypothetical protein